jgi:hypothetical protein
MRDMVVNIRERSRIIKEDGTGFAVVLMGNSLHENTWLHQRENSVLSYVNNRFYAFPDYVDIKIWRGDRFESAVGCSKQIEETTERERGKNGNQKSGSVVLKVGAKEREVEARVGYHILVKKGEKRLDHSSGTKAAGFFAMIMGNEIVERYDSFVERMEKMKIFGITGDYMNIVLTVEVIGGEMNFQRDGMLSPDHTKINIRDIGEKFSENLPPQIVQNNRECTKNQEGNKLHQREKGDFDKVKTLIWLNSSESRFRGKQTDVVEGSEPEKREKKEEEKKEEKKEEEKKEEEKKEEEKKEEEKKKEEKKKFAVDPDSPKNNKRGLLSYNLDFQVRLDESPWPCDISCRDDLRGNPRDMFNLYINHSMCKNIVNKYLEDPELDMKRDEVEWCLALFLRNHFRIQMTVESREKDSRVYVNKDYKDCFFRSNIHNVYLSNKSFLNNTIREFKKNRDSSERREETAENEEKMIA